MTVGMMISSNVLADDRQLPSALKHAWAHEHIILFHPVALFSIGPYRPRWVDEQSKTCRMAWAQIQLEYRKRSKKKRKKKNHRKEVSGVHVPVGVECYSSRVE